MEKKTLVATNEKVRNYISDDIALSILSKLPLKSLKRFGCVRKSWSLVLENTHFMNMLRKNFLSNLHCCSYNYDQASLFLKLIEPSEEVIYYLSGESFENKIKLDFSNPFANQLVYGIFGFGSINGILCLHDVCEYYYGKIVLWNPATQTTMLIPPSPFESVESLIPDVAMEFISVQGASHLHGFGYDNVNDDYKLIRHVCFDIHVPFEDICLESLLGDISLDDFWEIYSLRSNLWRKLDVDMPCSMDCREGTQLFINGVCHWLLCEKDNPYGKGLVSFYLSNEVFFITPMPSDEDDCFKSKVSWVNLVVLNGYIALISFHGKTFHISILDVLGMKGSWIKLFIAGPFPCIECPIGIGTKGEIFFRRNDKEIVWFDPSTQMIKELGYKAMGPFARIIIYKENGLAMEE